MGKSKDLATLKDSGLTVDAAAATVLTVDRATSDGAVIDVQKDGTSVGSIRSLSGDITIDGPSEHTGLRFEAADITPRHNASASNNYTNLGTASSRYKDLFLGGGLYIGGTGAANKLDDYEEGTWTPAPSQGTASTGTAWYIKIGNMVHCGANVWNFSDRSSNNHVQISVPFQSASGVTATGSMIGRFINTGTQSTWSPYLGAGESSIYFYRNPADAGYTTLKHSDLNNSNADMHWHITYKSV